MPVDESPSDGCFEIADFIGGSMIATHIAELHNAALELAKEAARNDDR